MAFASKVRSVSLRPYGTFRWPPRGRKGRWRQGAVVQAITVASGFAPDHAAVVWTDVAVKAALVQGVEDLVQVQGAQVGGVGRLLEAALAGPLDVSGVDEVDALAKLLADGHQVVVRTGAQGAGAQRDAVAHGGLDLLHAAVALRAGDDARAGRTAARGIVRVDGHGNVGLLAGGDHPVQEIGEVFQSFSASTASYWASRSRKPSWV